jgi:uncharacterized glyoxalase superfamily protein PhnB
MNAKLNTAVCVPFIKVVNLEKTIAWYEKIGFKCTATNLIWESNCELNWATIEWEGAAFMIGPDERQNPSKEKDSTLWFNVETVDRIVDYLKGVRISFDVEEETFYGSKVIGFKDPDGFGVYFSCEPDKKQPGTT